MPTYEVRANAYRYEVCARNPAGAEDIFIKSMGYNAWYEMREQYARLLALGQVPRDMCQNPDQLIQIREVG